MSLRRFFIQGCMRLVTTGLFGVWLLLYMPEASGDEIHMTQQHVSRTGFKVVDNGEARAIIVTPNTTSAVVKYAVTELRSHVELATGAKLDVIPEQDAATSNLKHRIYIGPCQAAEEAGLNVDHLPSNGFRIETTDKAIFLIGKDDQGKPLEPQAMSYSRHWKEFEFGAPPLDDAVSMGSLFAVYEWLEAQVGVKWLWPDETGTVVPRTTDLYVGKIAKRTKVPTLIHARPRLNTWAGMDPKKLDKYVYDTSVWLRRQRFARGVSFHYGHAYTTYWERFGATHPEYFALRPDGKRAPFNEKRPSLVQMCVSNPGLHRQIIADWLVQRKEKPDLPWINGAENDKTAQDPACTCEACRSWDAKKTTLVEKNPWLSGEEADKDGVTAGKISLSDRYARFWLALQKEGQKHDPDATVLAYAYADYTAPPLETKLNRNIIVGIVPPYSFPLDAKDREDFRSLWDGWAKTGARLYLRPNYFLIGYAMPYIFAEEFGEEFKYASENGMIGTDFDSLLGMWGVQGLNLYMMGRLNVDPKQKVADILDEYYSSFGAAAQPVREYFEYWKTITKKCDNGFKERSQGGWGFVSKSGDEVYTPEAFRKGVALLAKAEKAAGDTAAKERIAYLKLWLDHAELCMNTLRAFHVQRDKPKEVTAQKTFLQAKDALDEFRREHSDEIVNVGLLRQLEIWSGWRKSSER